MAKGRAPAGRARVVWSTLAALVLALLLAAPVATGVRAASGESADGSVRVAATPLLEGLSHPGDWLAIRVHVENDGPAVRGELRVTSSEPDAPRFSLPVELATGARQDHELYAQTSWFGGRWTLALVQDGASVVSVPIAVQSIETEQPVIALVAEQPERLLADMRQAMTTRAGQEGSSPPRFVRMDPAELPHRPEALETLHAIVWQDAPTATLEPDQLEALRTWLTLGGSLVLLGGTAGPAALEGIPDDLLPFRPDATVDIPATELATLVETVPEDLATLPSLSGTLSRGAVLAGGGDRVIAARTSVGRGSVTLLGFDPATPGLVGTRAATSLWLGVVPSGLLRGRLQAADDSGFLGQALGFLPTLDAPRIDLLVVLFVAYLLLLGPIGYLVLRRLDRREWAWITIPTLALMFTLVAYGVGVAGNGTQVRIRELGVVQGAEESDRGVADVAVGIVSPSRATLDLHIPGGALISRTASADPGTSRLDVVLGEGGGIRGIEVGTGAVRDFHVQRIVETPRVEATLVLAGDRLQGSVTNASDQALEQAHLAWGAGLLALGDLQPGQSVPVDLPIADPQWSTSLVERLFKTPPGPDEPSRRTALARVAILRAMSGGWNWNPASVRDPLGAEGPVVLGWTSGGILGADVGRDVQLMGDTLYVLPVAFTAAGPVSFGGGTLLQGPVRIDATDGWDTGQTLALGRGTMTMAYRPAGLRGELAVTELLLRLAPSHGAVGVPLEETAPLPPDRQPSPTDLLGTGPAPDATRDIVPRVQLFDRVANAWVELERFGSGRTYRVPDPGRYIDGTGAFRVRLVNRDPRAVLEFALDARITGTAS